MNTATVTKLMGTIPPAPPARRGLATWVLARLKDADVIDLSGWIASGDDLLVPFYEAHAALIGTIRIDQHATNVATISEDTPLYQALYAIGKLDVEFLEDRYGVTWQSATDELPGVIYVQDRSDSAFLRKLVNLVNFVREALTYGEGARVHEDLANQITLRNLTVRNLTEANTELIETITRLQALVTRAIEERKAS